MNIREAVSGIRRTHLTAEDFSALRQIIGSVTTETPEAVVTQVNGSSPLGQALLYDLALAEREEMRQIRENLGYQRLTNLCVAIRQHIEQPQTCRCGQTVPYGVYACPSCNATLAPSRSRRPESRPTQELLREIPSGGTHIGFPYKIRKNPDGSLSCDCLGYLKQTHLRPTNRGYAICRHIEQVETPSIAGIREPSDFQKAMLRSMGILPANTLTNDQAYFLIKDTLDQQGIDFGAYAGLVRQHGKAEGLPIWTVGWEFEGGLRERRELRPRVPQGWSIGTDGSVHPARGFQCVEIRSPKLFGKQSFQQMEQVLTACNEIGWNNTPSAGMHTHINASMTNPAQRVNLAKAWRESWKYIQFLVTPDRRNNTFCQHLSARDIRDIEASGAPSGGRYRDLNLLAFREHQSIEVRLHHCTANPAEVKGWTIFLLKFFEAAMVKEINHELFRAAANENSLDALLELIGMNGCAVRPVKEAADHIREKYERLRAGGITAVAEDLDTDTEAAYVDTRTPEERFWQEVNMQYSSMIAIPGETEGNLVNNLLRRRVSRRESFALLSGPEHLESCSWSFQGDTAEMVHNVSWNYDTDEVTCYCDYFSRNGFCRSSVAVARYLDAIRTVVDNPPENVIVPESLAASVLRVYTAERPPIEPVPVGAAEDVEVTATPEAPIEGTTAQEAVPEDTANVVRGLLTSEGAESLKVAAKRLYENYSWSAAANRADTSVPAIVWQAAGRRAGRMIPFEEITRDFPLLPGNTMNGSLTIELYAVVGRCLAPRNPLRTPNKDRLFLRVQLSFLMAAGLIDRRNPWQPIPAPVQDTPGQAEEASEEQGNVPAVTQSEDEATAARNGMLAHALRIYENYTWSVTGHRVNGAIPVEVWQAAGRRVHHREAFNGALQAAEEIMGSGVVRNQSFSVTPLDHPYVPYRPPAWGEESLLTNYLTPQRVLSRFEICTLRAHLSYLMAQRVV